MALQTTVIAGITVPFTPLIQDAIAHVKAESPAWLYHHTMRSWLFAAKLAAAENLTIDGETVALAAILHDIGLVAKYGTPERRFEVDGAAAAVSFIRARQTKDGTPPPGSAAYYQSRIREILVWDAIALHATASISDHGPAEVNICQLGIRVDIRGSGLEHLPDAKETVSAVLEAFPRLGMKDEIKDSFCALARTKPDTTYDNFVAAFGEAYVEGYRRSDEGDRQLITALATNPFDQ